MLLSKKFRFKSSVAIVQLRAGIFEFFESNERRSKRITTPSNDVKKIAASLNGLRTVEEVMDLCPDYEEYEFVKFIEFLWNEKFLIEIDDIYTKEVLATYGRTINFLESHSKSVGEVLRRFHKITSANILIIGCGGVGTWVANGLAAFGVRNFYLADDDIIEASNLNRQTGFGAQDIGQLKTQVLANRLMKIYGSTTCVTLGRVTSMVDIEKLGGEFDLVINCADEPSVDFTSKLVADYCTKRGIAHIIGGGYNLHLTLIGQLIIPGKTACFECFGNYFKTINDPEVFGFKKLDRKRTVGSFGPLCSFAASLATDNAIRYLSGVDTEQISGVNRRYEFSLSSLELSATEITKEFRCGNCGWGNKFLSAPPPTPDAGPA